MTTEPTPPRPTATLPTAADVLEVMLELVGPARAGAPALWVLFLDRERRVLPAVLPVEGLPDRPHAGLVDAVVQIAASVLQEQPTGAAAAFALVRADGGDRGTPEGAWCAALRTAADDADVPISLIAAIGRDRARVLEW